jgi:LacI family transcriptional regulator
MRVLIVADYTEAYNRRIIAGVADYAAQRDWELDQLRPNEPCDIAAVVESSGAQGLLLGAHVRETDPFFARRSLPTVGWSATLAEVNWPRVLPDDLMVGQSVADHFLSLGLKHFAFYTDLTGIWVDRRRDGFVTRLESAGHAATVCYLGHPAVDADDVIAWLRDLPRPIGLMLVHDGAAIKIMTACRRLGLRIPQDVAVVGVNDDDCVVDVVTPPLSTVPLQGRQIGYEAATLLDDIIHRHTRRPWSVLVPPGELIVRGSSDLVGQMDDEVGTAVRFIREHLAEGVEAKHVVSHIGVCRTTLNAKFVATLGRSVSAEIRRTRIEQCRRMLSTTDWPMPQIAKQAGFSSARQLSFTFHREVGMPPTRFRDLFRGTP